MLWHGSLPFDAIRIPAWCWRWAMDQVNTAAQHGKSGTRRHTTRQIIVYKTCVICCYYHSGSPTLTCATPQLLQSSLVAHTALMIRCSFHSGSPTPSPAPRHSSCITLRWPTLPHDTFPSLCQRCRIFARSADRCTGLQRRETCVAAATITSGPPHSPARP